MSLKEFYGWYNYYCFEPFGTQIDDRRHAQTMTTLHNIYAIQCTKKVPPLKTEDLTVSRMTAEVEKLKKWLYTDLDKPWQDSQKTNKQMVAEGKALLAHWSAQTGIAIK